MKNKLKKAARAALCLLLCVLICASAASCGKEDEAALSIENTSFSGRVYAYYMACFKQYWLTYFGQTDSKDFWDAETDGVKYSEYLESVSLESIKKRLCSVFLFDSFGLKISDAENTAIDRMLAAIEATEEGRRGIENDELFSALGMDRSDLRQLLVIDAKTAALQDHLYGEDGVYKITDEQRESFYQKNYCRFRMLYLMNYDYDLNEDGSYKYDSDGSVKVLEISDERYEEKIRFADSIRQRVLDGEDFETLIQQYTEDLSADKYRNGRYVTEGNGYFQPIADAVTNMEIGEMRLFQTQIGIHLVQRIELDDYGWKSEANGEGEDFANFESLITEQTFDAYIEPYMKNVTVNTDVTGKYKMEDLPYTFSWRYLLT